ncbi:MAG: phage integrase [Conexibacter sp.]|nr:phage integrase [Conexibacter sp.]
MGQDAKKERSLSISRLPSGRWRAQVWSPKVGRNLGVGTVLSRGELERLQALNGTFRTKAAAKIAREFAREKLSRGRREVTVGEFYLTWTTDPLFARPKRSTNIHNAERVSEFAARYGHVPIADCDDAVAAAYLAGGERNARVPALCAFFNDARKAKAGRLTDVNPFERLGLARSQGNKNKKPPTWEELSILLVRARDLTPPSFADYFQTACFTGMRPGELDALGWKQIRWDDEEIDVTLQWNVKAREFTEPKYGPYTIALVERAKEPLLRAFARRDNDAEYVFTTLRGHHYTPSTRIHHWDRVRTVDGLGDWSLYLATKHFFGSYALNQLGLDPAIIAEQFGHRDGGKLVEQLYGHPDKRRRRDLLRQAFNDDPRQRVARRSSHVPGTRTAIAIRRGSQTHSPTAATPTLQQQRIITRDKTVPYPATSSSLS